MWNKEDGPMQTALRLVDKEAMDKQRALDAALGQIERAFGKGSIMKLGAREAATDAEVISTGSLGLDIALGIGGLPRGRIIAGYGAGKLGQDHPGAPCHRRGAEGRRYLRLRRCRACARSRLCPQARCQYRRVA